MSRNTIFDNTLRLDCFALDIIEQAKDFYAQTPSGNPVRDRVEHWFEDYFLPAFECAIEDTFKEDNAE